MKEKTRRIINMLSRHIPTFERQILDAPIIENQDNIIIREDLDDELYGKILSDFIDKMIENYNEKDLAIFYNNINTMNIDYTVNNSRDAGEYDIVTNSLGLNAKKNDMIEEILQHELLHASSSYYDRKNGIAYSGFAQFYNNGTYIGKGLMEGYSQLFNERILYPNDYNLFEREGALDIYPFEVLIAREIEKIVGADKTQSLYLRADLKNLIKELKYYSSSKDVIKLISLIDYLHMSLLISPRIPAYEGLTYIKTANYVVYSFKLMLLKKYKEDCELGYISNSDFKDKVDGYVDVVDNNPTILPKNKIKIKSKALDLLKH